MDPLVIKIPNDLSFEQAATMPACYTPAVQSLIDVGQLEKGQVRVILHFAHSCPSASEVPSTSRAKPYTLDLAASYLLTGGLGGLGESVASWMVEKGARNLVSLSRSAGTNEEDKSFFAEMRSMSCSVSAVVGKAEDMEVVETVVKKASRPIKGIVYLAMVLRVYYLAFIR